MMINSVVLSGKKNVSKDSEFLLWGWQMGHQTDVYGELIREQEGITSPPPCVWTTWQHSECAWTIYTHPLWVGAENVISNYNDNFYMNTI